jgi:hypothetical protein
MEKIDFKISKQIYSYKKMKSKYRFYFKNQIRLKNKKCPLYESRVYFKTINNPFDKSITYIKIITPFRYEWETENEAYEKRYNFLNLFRKRA